MYTYNLGQFFHNVCEQYRNKTAIIFDGKEYVTFHELDVISNKLAYFLMENGVEKRDVVAIQNRKSPLGVAMMLACLKLGVIYTNFDYTNPKERIHKIFVTALPRLVFADEYNESIDTLCGELNIPYFSSDKHTGFLDKQKDDLDIRILNAVSGSNPAYIMFTSGSTGIPKGVLISQKSILNFIQWGKEIYKLSPKDIMTNVNPIYFDNSVFDFYCSVFNGITLVALSKSVVSNPKEMLEIVHDAGCTIWFSVPSMLIYLMNLKLLTDGILSNVRIFAFGGEGYPKELLRKLYSIYKDTADFYNVYGPTEGTCICSAYKITKEDMDADGLAPLGNIAPNFDYIILNENGEQSSFGELYLMGEQLALGYYNDTERTAQSFVKVPFIRTYYERAYKTGDLVEFVDGKLYFRGRVDNQIKHMGYRIELEEIENALIKLPGIRQCAVIHTLSKNNYSRLVGYAALDDVNRSRNLKEELRQYLPDYMIPNEICLVDELPKNANGKVDRQSLKNIKN